jgi:hypothetical protein
VTFDVSSLVDLGTGTAGDAYVVISENVTTAYEVEDCGQGELSSNCRDGLGFAPIEQLTDTTITLYTNIVFNVHLAITLNPGVVNGNEASATIDPEFFLPSGSDDTIEYSSGISQAEAQSSATTPEPATLTLLGAGLSALFCARRKRQTQG